MIDDNNTHLQDRHEADAEHKKPAASLLRIVQVVSLTLGVALVGLYVAAKIDSRLASKSAIENFKRARIVDAATIRQGLAAPEPVSAEPVDTTLWSAVRIDGYQQSLFADLDLPLAVLNIPKIGLEVPVFDGTDDLTLNRGAGRIEGTALPGQPGNSGIAAHRDGFFRLLSDVELGDRIIVETIDSSSTFVIEDIRVVEPTDVWVLEPTDSPSVTLVTCYPFYFVGSAPQRYIVRAALKDTEETPDS